MSREELRKIPFKRGKYDPDEALFSGESVLDAMVAAYNRGIDDAVEHLQDNVEYDVEACYKLKI